MLALTFFESIWTENTLLFSLLFYILLAITFGAHFSCCNLYDRPVLLNSFNSTSLFFICLLFCLFSYDFSVCDKLFFFSQNFQLLFVFFCICVLFCSYDFLKSKKIKNFEYDLFIIFIIFSALCLSFCTDFLLIYLAIELQSLTFYVLAVFQRNSEFSSEAGLKYFIFGGLFSCFLLFGFCLVYLFYGFVSFELLSSIGNFGFDPLFFSGFVFILISMLFKVGSAPFHVWLCDVYEGSILSVTLLFASAPKIIIFSLILKLCFFVFFDYNFIWSYLLGYSGILSIVIGSICAIYQKRIKRLLTYSTISHTGFILLAFFCCSLAGLKSLIFYVIIYSTLTVTIFSILINMSIQSLITPKYLINISGIGSNNYVFATSFSLIILAIAGIPPLAGFFSKFFVIFSVIGSDYYFTALIIIIFSSISCFYYIRIVKIMFFVKTLKNSIWLTNKAKQNTELVCAVFSFIILFYFLNPTLVLNLSIAVSFLLF